MLFLTVFFRSFLVFVDNDSSYLAIEPFVFISSLDIYFFGYFISLGPLILMMGIN